MVQQAGDAQGGPRGVGGRIAVRPIGGQPVVAARVDQLQAAAAAITPPAPTPAGAVEHLVHDDVNDAGLDHSAEVCGVHGIRHGQGDSFAGIAQRAGIIADGVVRGQRRGGRRVIGDEASDVFGDDEVAIDRDDGVGRKREINALGEAPVGEVDGVGAAVVKLHELIIIITGDGVVHDFVDHEITGAQPAVGSAGRFCRQPVEGGGAVRRAARRHAVFLRVKRDRIDDARQIRVDQEDELTTAAQSKAEHGFGEENEACRPNHRAVRDAEFVRRRFVAQPAAGQIHRHGAVVVKFDVIELRQICIREKFVDDHIAQRLIMQSVHAARRAAKHVTLVPCQRIVLAIRRMRQFQRVTGAVGGQRPRRLTVVIDFQQDGARAVAQAHRAGFVGETFGIRSGYVLNAIDVLDVRRTAGNDEETAPRQCRSWRESVAHVPGNAVAADVLRDRVGVV